ncbi:MAG TPA: phytanoyl-CoA dioxygenase family protein, partial [Bryobacteraceae bacterium]
TSAWIALTDSRQDNGCMRVIPGSHRDGIRAHAETAVSPANMLASGMEVKCEVDERMATDVVLEPGEVSFHDVAVVHGSNPNLSPRMRMGFAVRYIAPALEQRLDHIPTVLVRGEDRARHFRLLTNPPAAGGQVNLEEAVRAQAALSAWILTARASAEPIPFPPGIGLKWIEPGRAE